jgi:hypothetical protein
MVLLGVGLAMLWAASSGTLSAWTSAGVANPTNSTGSKALSFNHTYQSTSCSQGIRTSGTSACSGSIAPTAATPASGSVTGTDTITNNGTYEASQLESAFSAPSCAPVKLDNRKTASNPLLARYGTTFHTSGGPMDSVGYVSVDGANPGGYATSVAAQSQPPTSLISAGTFSGVGVWFKAASGTQGPLLSFSSSASNGAGNDDRALFLDASGKLNLTWNASGTKLGATSSSYTDNAWHFAYVTYGGINVAIIGLIPQVNLYVDGVNVGSTPLLSLSPLSSYSGYWHLGWAPTSVTGLSKAYIAADLSNFVVINSGTIPAGTTIGKPATQAAFNTATSSSTEHWVLNDLGTTTFSGTLPSSMAAPCSMVNFGWSTTNPTGTVTTSTPLSSFANGTAHVVAAPTSGGSQTSTITTSRGGSYNTDISGLHLYAPISHTVQTTPTPSSWQQTFTWAGAESAFIG